MPTVREIPNSVKPNAEPFKMCRTKSPQTKIKNLLNREENSRLNKKENKKIRYCDYIYEMQLIRVFELPQDGARNGNSIISINSILKIKTKTK